MIAGCTSHNESADDKKNAENKHRFVVPKGQDIFETIIKNGYNEIDFLRPIIGNRIAEKAKLDSTVIEIASKNDTIQIDQAKISSFNAEFCLVKAAADSIGYIVNVHKPILKGGSIFQVLSDLGMNGQDVGYYTWKLGEYIDATSIDVGDIISVSYFTDTLQVKHFEKFSYQPDKTSIHEFYIEGDRKLRYNLVELPYKLVRKFITGSITAEFPTWDAAMNELHIIPYIRQQANNAMDSQIAFSTDARFGDTFEVYIEEKHVNDERQPRGKLLYCKYSGKYTGTKTAYRFSDDDPASAYTGMYTTSAKRLVTDAVRTPLDKMHITSPFGYRIHPIYGVKKMHTGIDLRGWTGTAVYAVTAGTVIKAKNNGNGYGKEVLIRHDNGMVTQYAHLSRITTSYGKRVRKGQLIGKIGSTGVSTGPHLHFGVKKNGKWVNPKTNLKMVGANTLSGNRLKTFKNQMKQMDKEMKEEAPVKIIEM